MTDPPQLPLLVLAPVRARVIARLSPEQRARNVARLREILAAIEATPDWRGRRSRP